MKDFSLPKIGNFELTQQEKTIVGKEETSKINTVKNETTFILEMKLSFENSVKEGIDIGGGGWIFKHVLYPSDCEYRHL